MADHETTTSRVQAALLTAYGLVQKSGALDLPVVSRLMTRAYFVYKHLYESDFRRFLRESRHLLCGGDIVDVGANVGFTVLCLARYLDPGRVIHAFEPDATNFEKLCRTVQGRGLADQVRCVEAAVGERAEVIELWLNDDNPADHRILTDSFKESLGAGQPTRTAQMVSLDEHLAHTGAPPVSFVKIDVQGYEPSVLAGMAGTIEANPALCICTEYCPGLLETLGFDAPGFLEALEAHGFGFSLIERNGSLAPTDRDRLLALDLGTGYIEIVCQRKPARR